MKSTGSLQLIGTHWHSWTRLRSSSETVLRLRLRAHISRADTSTANITDNHHMSTAILWHRIDGHLDGTDGTGSHFKLRSIDS